MTDSQIREDEAAAVSPVLGEKELADAVQK